MSKRMRAKMMVCDVQNQGLMQQKLVMRAVAREEGYSGEGWDEDNTYAKFTPSADLTIIVANPELHNAFALGDKVYVDFTKCERKTPADVPKSDPIDPTLSLKSLEDPEIEKPLVPASMSKPSPIGQTLVTRGPSLPVTEIKK